MTTTTTVRHGVPVGMLEIAELAGVTRQAVDRWIARHASFPQAPWTVGGDRAWVVDDVIAWLRATGRWPTRSMADAIRCVRPNWRDVEADRWSPALLSALLEAGWLDWSGPGKVRPTPRGRAAARIVQRMIDNAAVCDLAERDWGKLRALLQAGEE